MAAKLRAKPGGDRLSVTIGDFADVPAEGSYQLVYVAYNGLFRPLVRRYAWLSELDLMARIAGLRLNERWGGWSREPFTSASRLHISVYTR